MEEKKSLRELSTLDTVEEIVMTGLHEGYVDFCWSRLDDGVVMVIGSEFFYPTEYILKQYVLRRMAHAIAEFLMDAEEGEGYSAVLAMNYLSETTGMDYHVKKEEKKMKKFDVTYAVDGSFTVTVEATDEAEAIDKADDIVEDEFASADSADILANLMLGEYICSGEEDN